MEQIIQELPLIVVIVFLVVGFALLIKGADLFVGGSSSIAEWLHVPGMIIGLTIVAMGTSLPETAVSVAASMAHNNELAISNAVGSNIFNMMVVIGVCAMMRPVAVERVTIRRDIPFSAICAVMLLSLGVMHIGFLSGRILGRGDGITLLILFVLFLLAIVHRSKKSRKNNQEAAEETYEKIGVFKSLLLILFGSICIGVGGSLTVKTASRIAMDLGLSENLVGLTIVSVGTSLPELVTSIVAARKNQVGMALGNAIGSNIFNILMVLGLAAAISPISMGTENIIDIVVLMVFTLFVWIFAVTKREIQRIEGLTMLVMYMIYLVYICLR